jgi:hypothetical protein
MMMVSNMVNERHVCYRIFQKLVSKGAKLDFKDNNNKTAKDYWRWTHMSFDDAVAEAKELHKNNEPPAKRARKEG